MIIRIQGYVATRRRGEEENEPIERFCDTPATDVFLRDRNGVFHTPCTTISLTKKTTHNNNNNNCAPRETRREAANTGNRNGDNTPYAHGTTRAHARNPRARCTTYPYKDTAARPGAFADPWRPSSDTSQHSQDLGRIARVGVVPSLPQEVDDDDEEEDVANYINANAITPPLTVGGTG